MLFLGIFQPSVPAQSVQPDRILSHTSKALQTPPPSQEILELLEKIKKENQELKKQNAKLMTENVTLTKEKKEAREELRETRIERNLYKSKMNSLCKIVVAGKKGRVPKKVQDIIIRNRLKDKLSPAQLDVWLNNRTKSRNWSHLDFRKAKKLRGTLSC